MRASDANPPLLSAALFFGLFGLIVVAGRAMGLAAVADGTGAAVLSGLASVVIVLSFLRYPKPALLAFALLMLFGDSIDRYAGYTMRYLDDVTVPLLFVLTAWRARPWRTGRLAPVREGAVVAVVALGIAASLVNGVPPFVWLSGLLLMSKVIAFFYIAAWMQFSRDDIRAYAIVLAPIAFVVIGLGFVEALDPATFRAALGLNNPSPPRGGLPSVKSVFFHPVLYGWLAAVAGLYLMAGYAVYRRWWMLVVGLLCTVGVVLSARRRAIIGLVAALAGGLASRISIERPSVKLARAWAPIIGGTLAVTLLFGSGMAELLALTERKYVNPELNGSGGNARVLLYVHSVDVAAENFPLGAGLGRYASRMSAVEYSPLYHRFGFERIPGLSPDRPNYITDTFWPQILGELGVLGLIAYLVFVAAIGFDVWRAARAFRDPLLLVFCLGTLMVFGHALVETLASSLFHSPPRIYLLFGAVGMAVSFLYADRDGARPARSAEGSLAD